MSMEAMVLTNTRTYLPGKLAEAMRAVQDESNDVVPKGYALVGFQVVESEKMIVSLYRRMPAATGAVLTGE